MDPESITYEDHTSKKVEDGDDEPIYELGTTGKWRKRRVDTNRPRCIEISDWETMSEEAKAGAIEAGKQMAAKEKAKAEAEAKASHDSKTASSSSSSYMATPAIDAAP